jgi:signal transduction histidine kinase
MATVGALVIRSLFRRTLANISATSIAIAHDLRTPITRARARLEDAALHAEGADDLRAAIERATLDLDGIVGVFQALLRIAEIEAGSRRSLFARLDLTPLLREVAELYGAVAEERGVVLRLETPEAMPAYGDRAMVHQAIANLVDNAVKFSPDGGTVRLTALVTATVLVTVEDQGPGIPLADRAKATDRFYRGESARSTPGSGLGLSLVLAVAHLHGGTLRLEDNRPGLRAILSLPLPEATEVRPAPVRTAVLD